MTESRTRTRADRRRAKGEPASDKRPLARDLRVVETQVFRGPNYWSYEPCIRMLVDLGSLEEWPSHQIPGFNEGLLALLPGVADVVMHDPELARLYVAVGDPGVVCSFDSDRLELLETVATEPGAHTTGWDPDGRCLYVFCAMSCGAAVYEERD